MMAFAFRLSFGTLRGIGSVTKVLVTARETFKAAILANAVSLILFRNHPGGEPTPSLEDVRVTQELRKAGELLGIPIANHLILGSSSGILMREAGHFDLTVTEDGTILKSDGQVLPGDDV